MLANRVKRWTIIAAVLGSAVVFLGQRHRHRKSGRTPNDRRAGVW
jgi:hypothetical protein